jgi:large subunit ribosomal protein L32
MPEPKKRKTHRNTRIRRSTKNKTQVEAIKCPKCDTLILPHHICSVCGTYKRVKYIDVEKRERKKKEREKEEAQKEELNKS